MTKRRVIFAIVVCLVFGQISMASAASTLKKLGTHAFYTPALTSVEDLKSVMAKKSADVKTGFEMAGYGDLADGFLQAVASGDIQSAKVQPGTTMEWMLYRRNGKGKVRVAKDVTWAGAAAFDAYQVKVTKDGTIYNIVVPLICTNVALLGSSPVPPPPPVVKPAPKPVPPPPVVRNLFPFVDLGWWRQFDPANYVGVRGGLQYRFTENFAVTGLVGGLIKADGSDGTSAFHVDALANFMVDRFWLGLGGGYRIPSDSDKDDNHFDIVANVGVRVYGDPQAFNASVFLEARIPVDETSDLSTYGRFGAGIRLMF